jgi:hypothetical protein
MLDYRHIAVMGEVVGVSKSGVVGVSMRDNSPIHRPPRINVHTGLWAKNPFGIEAEKV